MTTGNVAVTSKGAAVEYGILNGTIVGDVDANGDNLVNGTDRLVFKLEPNGADFTFTLLDQIDHLPKHAGERRQPDACAGPVGRIPGDGCRRRQRGADDGGDGECRGRHSGQQQHDAGCGSGAGGRAGELRPDRCQLRYIFGSTGNNEGGKTFTAQITAAALTPTVSVGVDEPATFSLNLTAAGQPGTIVGTAVVTTGNVAVTSKGAAVEYGILNGTIVGYVDANNDNVVNGTDRLVFKLEPNGADFTFTLLDQIDHLPNTPANDDSQTLALDLSGAFLATGCRRRQRGADDGGDGECRGRHSGQQQHDAGCGWGAGGRAGELRPDRCQCGPHLWLD